MRITLFSTMLVLSVLWGEVNAQDLARGKQVYQLCGQCHGNAGEGTRRYNAPVIAGLPTWYIESQLTKFKQGHRGFKAEDTTGLQMRPMARSLVKESDLKNVTAYVAAMKPVLPPSTVQGDATKGQASYTPCVACHGAEGKGNQALGAPTITHQADWYLLAQLQKFKSGLRGTHPKDTTGMQMRSMSMTLADEQAMRDVVAYIRTLAK